MVDTPNNSAHQYSKYSRTHDDIAPTTPRDQTDPALPKVRSKLPEKHSSGVSG